LDISELPGAFGGTLPCNDPTNGTVMVNSLDTCLTYVPDADFIGLDVCLSILRVLQDGFGQPKYAPNPLLVNMVMAGKLGVKSGEGFYTYTKGSKEIVVAPAFS
jgi:hypothetical protein